EWLNAPAFAEAARLQAAHAGIVQDRNGQWFATATHIDVVPDEAGLHRAFSAGEGFAMAQQAEGKLGTCRQIDADALLDLHPLSGFRAQPHTRRAGVTAADVAITADQHGAAAVGAPGRSGATGQYVELTLAQQVARGLDGQCGDG